MRSRAPSLVAVVVFALAVALVALVAGRGGDQQLVKLPAGASAGTASGEAMAAPAADAMSSRSGLLYPMQFEYKVEGTLGELPSEAPGYRLGSATTAAAVARLAASLGLAGDVQAEPTGWVVTDGGLQLRVERMAGLPWYVGMGCPDAPVSSKDEVASACAVAVDTPMPLPVDKPGSGGGSAGSAGNCPAEGCVDAGSAPVATAVACGPAGECAAPAPPVCDGPTVKCAAPATVAPCEPGTACVAPEPSCPPDVKCSTVPAPACAPDQHCAMPMPEPVERPARPSDLPSEDEARTLAGAAFERLGVRSEGMVVDDGWDAWYVRVEARVGGLDVIGMGTSLTIGPKGEITGGNGFLAAPELIGDYPLAGVEAGLERLRTGVLIRGAGARDVITPEPMPDAAGAIEPAPAACGDPAVSCIADPVMPTPVVQTITGAHLALLFNGDALVPAYVFELADGGSMPVVAVTDEWLDKAN